MIKKLIQALVVVQSELSILTQDVLSNGVISTCHELGLGFVAFSPLSRALLTPAEKIHLGIRFSEGDFRRDLPRFNSDNLPGNLKIRDALHRMAEAKQCSLPQLALAWVMTQNDCVVPIPGTRKSEHLTIDNLGAANIILTQEDLVHINEIVTMGVHGERYTAAMFTAQRITSHPVAAKPLMCTSFRFLESCHKSQKARHQLQFRKLSEYENDMFLK